LLCILNLKLTHDNKNHLLHVLSELAGRVGGEDDISGIRWDNIQQLLTHGLFPDTAMTKIYRSQYRTLNALARLSHMESFRKELVHHEDVVEALVQLTALAVQLQEKERVFSGNNGDKKQRDQEEDEDEEDAGGHPDENKGPPPLPPLFQDLLIIAQHALKPSTAETFIQSGGDRLIFHLSTSYVTVDDVPFITLMVKMFVEYETKLQDSVRDDLWVKILHLASFGSPHVQAAICNLAGEQISNPFNYIEPHSTS